MVLAVLLTGAAAAAAQKRDVPALDAPVPAAAASRTRTPGDWPRLHLADPVGRQAVRQALDLAWRRLADPDCADVLGAFKDQTGRPIGDRLHALALDPPAYLTLLVFEDGSRDAPCVTGVLAFTAPASRVVRVCVDEIKRTWQQDPEHTVASFIHEMLHTLGLDENPPSPTEITRRVLAGCVRRR